MSVNSQNAQALAPVFATKLFFDPPIRSPSGIVKLSAIFATIAGALDLKQP
jgi:hypothetical protein